MTDSNTGLISAVIFDCDGVLLESNDLKTEGFTRVFAAYPEHADAMVAFHHAHVSASRYDKFRHLVHDRLGRPVDDPLVEALADRFSSEMMRLTEACPFVAGAERLLDRLQSAGLPLFVVSMTPEPEIQRILARRGIADRFVRVYGCPPWTKPRAIREILAGLDAPRRAVFIGDSAGDQRAATDTGIEFLARDSGLAFGQPPPRVYPDLAALGAAIEARLP